MIEKMDLIFKIITINLVENANVRDTPILEIGRCNTTEMKKPVRKT